MSIKEYDVIVIGAGPAGYVAAIRAAQLGLKIACIDNWRNRNNQPSLGGTYINAGCIPSIALLESASLYHLLNHDIETHGIHVKDVTLDLPRMIARKDEISARLSAQISDVFKHNHIDCIHAHGRLLDQSKVEITHIDHASKSVISAESIILATGSSPITLPCAPIDNEFIIDSNAALNLETIPNKLGIIGAGIIGFELASIWNKLGSETILLDAQECFLHSADQQIADEARRLYSKQGLDIRLGARVISTKKENNSVNVVYQNQLGTHCLKLDKLIVSTGRQPNTEHISAPEANLLFDEEGFVHVDEFCKTTLPGVYAIGDLTQSGPMLAHKGLEEGVCVAERIAGQPSLINYDIIPSVIYTDPEIAWVGQTEQALKTIGEDIKVGTFPIGSTGRAQAIGKTDGLLKIITHAGTDLILGVHIIGHNASELIAEAVIAMEFSASAEDLARTIHAHPTISEAMHEAALVLENRSLHLPPEQ